MVFSLFGIIKQILRYAGRWLRPLFFMVKDDQLAEKIIDDDDDDVHDDFGDPEIPAP
jgi:hypothetical protein